MYDNSSITSEIREAKYTHENADMSQLQQVACFAFELSTFTAVNFVPK